MSNDGSKYICNFFRLFYYAIVDFEMADGGRVSFPTDASNYQLALFHGSLTSHLRDIGPPTISFVCPMMQAIVIITIIIITIRQMLTLRMSAR